ncbi:MAG: hypothetical protein CM1200mP20_07110 [Pseudomonadota bacterium]|nr:MAG: hypothetical protein CM1200mP20_07110 [Pseudomonadota bacterium]
MPKHHEGEARIIAQAGQPGAVTIATNMAGRGTDIVLGGNLDMELKGLVTHLRGNGRTLWENWEERHNMVVAGGGLHVLGGRAKRVETGG